MDDEFNKLLAESLTVALITGICMVLFAERHGAEMLGFPPIPEPLQLTHNYRRGPSRTFMWPVGGFIENVSP